MEMSRFEVGKKYRVNAGSRYLKGCKYVVVKRTEHFVFFRQEFSGEVIRRKPLCWQGNEHVSVGDSEGLSSKWVE